ncbi:glycosyl hydrolase [Actinomadura madurae]
MLAQAKSKGLGLDFTIGPRWPAIVPTVDDVNDPSAQQQIVFSHEFHKGGTSRSGELPTNFNVAPPAGAKRTLIAALVAKCDDADCASSSAPRMLDRASVTDVTSKVDAQGALTVDFPGDGTSTYALIAFYQTPSGQSLSGYTATGTNYALDPFSKAGARATTDFYDEHILTPDVRKLLAQMGQSDLFEDSLELGSTQKWTSELVGQWTKLRGYDPVEVLPALAGAGDQGITDRPFFDFGGGAAPGSAPTTGRPSATSTSATGSTCSAPGRTSTTSAPASSPTASRWTSPRPPRTSTCPRASRWRSASR